MNELPTTAKSDVEHETRTMPLTESMLLTFEERAHDLASCAAGIADIVSGDALPLHVAMQTFAGTPHEQAAAFSEGLVECCDLRLRAETHWLESTTWGSNDIDLTSLPSTMGAKEREALALLFYCAARLTVESPWLESTSSDFIDLAALPRPTADALDRDATRTPIAFSFHENDADLAAVFLASGPNDSLERFAIAYDLLKRCGTPYDAVHHDIKRATTASRHTPISAPQPACEEDLLFLDDEELERQRAQAEREFAESERRAFGAWRAGFTDEDAFCEAYEKLHAAWRAGNVPTNAGLLAREGLDVLKMQRGASLYRDDTAYYRALEALQDTLALLQRLAGGERR